MTLDISNSYLVGTLPERIGEMTNLKVIDLSGNDFHGELPTQIGQLSILEELNLSENLLSGVLPNEELSSITKLKHLSISRKTKSGRKMTGPLPSCDMLPELQSLTLDGNDFSGPIPIDFLAGSYYGIESFNISGNRLTGAVPSALTLLPGAETATTQTTLPSRVDERELLVKFFDACGGDAWTRRDFWTSKVDFCSWHGIGCSDDGHVVLLNLQSNNLVGSVLPEIFSLPRLEVLWLGGNPELKVSLEAVEFSPVLRDLKLQNTGLETLRGIDAALSLTALDVSDNSIGGPFPGELLNLANLRMLNLSNNTFDGELVSSLDSLPYLRILDLSHNKFSGHLKSFRSSVALKSVTLGYNEIGGTVPHDFLASVPSFVAPKVYLQGNKLSGSLPVELKRFENLTLDIRENRIDAVPSVLCEQSGWNSGAVGMYGCGALACAPGTANQNGRQSLENPKCVSCPAAAHFYGQTDCTVDNVSGPDALSTVQSVCHRSGQRPDKTRTWSRGFDDHSGWQCQVRR